MKIDKKKALEILQKEVNDARLIKMSGAWVDTVSKLSALCEKASKTNIAALGTALLAKATDLNVDVFSLQVKDPIGGERAYSARSLVKDVLAAHATGLGIDLGVGGPEPLNNQPFIGEPRITAELCPDDEAFACLIKALKALDAIKTPKEARAALRAFLQVRKKEQVEVTISQEAGDSLEESGLIELIAKFVGQDSELGKRAQIVVAGLLDAMVGEGRIRVGKIHDPSRHFPGDVGIFEELGSKKLERVFEVRDKPVTRKDIENLVERVRKAGLTKVAMVGVAKGQAPVEESSLIDWASDRQIRLGMFFGWERFVRETLFWSGLPGIAVGCAYRAILKRAQEQDVSKEGIELWVSAVN